MTKSLLGAAVMAVGLLTAHGADAAVIFATGNPGNGGTDNVIFNACTVNVTDGLTVNGCLNTNHATLVDFFNAGESLHVDGGQARIEATDGAFSQLEFGFNDPFAGFTLAIFNLNNIQGATGTVVITANLLGGGSFSSGAFAIANGSNFFNVVANGDDVIDTIFFASSIGIDSVTFQDARQFRLGGGGAGGGDVTVPEPTMLSILGLGLLGSAYRLRRRSNA